MKPGISITNIQWVLGLVGAACVLVSHLDHFTWQAVLGAVGGLLTGGSLGVNVLGKNQVHIDDLPAEVRDSFRPQ